jgi:hypothetical protein
MTRSRVAFRLKFSDPPANVDINAVNCTVEQRLDVQQGGKTEKLLKEDLSVFSLTARSDRMRMLKPTVWNSLDKSVLSALQAGQSAEVQGFGRLPGHRSLRPSTSIQRADSPLQIQHTLCMKVVYSVKGGKTKILCMDKSIQINSVSLLAWRCSTPKVLQCILVAQNILLPAYSEKESKVNSEPDCKCKFSNHKLVAQCLGLVEFGEEKLKPIPLKI